MTIFNELTQHKSIVVQQLKACDPELLNDHLDLIVCSDFVVNSLQRSPEWLSEITKFVDLTVDYRDHLNRINQALSTISSEDELMSVLRLYRRKYLLKLEMAQLSHYFDTPGIYQRLSALAEGIILAANEWLYQSSCQMWGTPTNSKGVAQPMLILGMGKLGGYELNFSSDIDLIFTYPESGLTQGGRKELDNVTFFTRLGQRLIKVLNQMTDEGQVYRVDMRLRPLGEGGPLAISFVSMEDYYQEQGRDWERYAMVKVKVLGDQNSPFAQAFYKMIAPFVYRRYIDFSVLQSLRNMKSMIEKEVRRRGLINNIKLGAGGIREVEFIVQVFQLIRGGRIRPLQTRSLLNALEVIRKEHLLSEEEVQNLYHHYLFLRRTENILQGIADEQTQTLPSSSLNQARLAYAMDFQSWEDFLTALNQGMKKTRAIFNALIGEESAVEEAQSSREEVDLLWSDDLTESDIKIAFPHFDEETLKLWSDSITQFKQELLKRRMGTRGREVLDRLIPLFLEAIAPLDEPHIVLKRIFELLLNIASRTTYLELLIEYPTALNQLVTLCSASPMISQQLTRYPILLDELIDSHSLMQVTDFQEYKSELHQFLLRIDSEDEEQLIDALRLFKQQKLLHIAVADLNHTLPTMKVSDHLTYLAEAIIEKVVQIAWNSLTARYGKPNHLQGSDKGLLIIGYGKLGGIELGYGSDLDLVFLHNCPTESKTDGDKELDGRQFYLKLVQRIIHLFNIQTVAGILYEVDIRLRPQGDSGLLACSLEAFETYQSNEAWIWEHQALVRARAVFGETPLQDQFHSIRKQILIRQRDSAQLSREVQEMREKMRTHLSSKNEQLFDLKHDQGGIGDIEFISQYLVLNYAHDFHQMAIWSDNVRILEMAEITEILQHNDAEELTKIYIEMRNEIHRLALQNKPSKVDSAQFKEDRKQVMHFWKQIFIS